MGAEALREVPLWVGRDGLLVALEAALIPAESQAAPKVLVLVGQGGIGKTSLAMKLLEELGVDRKRGLLTDACAYDGVVCFRAEEGAGFDEVAGELLSALGLGQQELFKDEEKIRAILAGLRQQRWLVLLDNWEVMLHPGNAAQTGYCMAEALGQLLNQLVCEQHQSQVVITSRERLKDLADQRDGEGGVDPRLVREEVIEGIDDRASVALLLQIGLRDSEADLQWIAGRVQGNVLVLTLLARWAKKPGMLRKRPALVVSRAEAIVREQLARQSEAAQELLKRMVVLRVPIDVEGLTFLRLHERGLKQDLRLWLANMTQKPAKFRAIELDQTQTILENLVDSSLVQIRYDEQQQNDFYDLHRVIGDVLRGDFAEALPELMGRVYAFYRAGGAVEAPKELEDLRPLLEAQHFAFQLGNYGEAEQLIYRLEKYLQPWGHWSLQKQLCEQIVSKLDEGDRAYILQRLGSVECNWGNWNKAEQLYQQALVLAQQAEHKGLVASLTGQLGVIERNRGNWDEAERLFRKSLKLREELGDRSGIATSCGVLGDIERNHGNWDEAEQLYRKSIEIAQELGDQAWVARVTSERGANELGRGNLELAESFLKKALGQLEQLGMTQAIAENHEYFAKLYRAKGNPDLAQTHYTTAHRLFTQLGAAKDLERIEKEWTET